MQALLQGVDPSVPSQSFLQPVAPKVETTTTTTTTTTTSSPVTSSVTEKISENKALGGGKENEGVSLHSQALAMSLLPSLLLLWLRV
jgi:hypothetical protein